MQERATEGLREARGPLGAAPAPAGGPQLNIHCCIDWTGGPGTLWKTAVREHNVWPQLHGEVRVSPTGPTGATGALLVPPVPYWCHWCSTGATGAVLVPLVLLVLYWSHWCRTGPTASGG